MERFYCGPHLCRALACLNAGRPDNAVTWMWLDIGEEASNDGEMPEPRSLRRSEDGLPFVLPAIAYVTVADANRGLAGDGI